MRRTSALILCFAVLCGFSACSQKKPSAGEYDTYTSLMTETTEDFTYIFETIAETETGSETNVYITDETEEEAESSEPDICTLPSTTKEITTTQKTAKQSTSASSAKAKTTVKETTTKIKETTRKTTVTTVPETTLPYVVKTVTEDNHESVTLKFGVVKNTDTEITYDIYNDGNKVEHNRKSKSSYDNSNYAADAEELLAEANANRSLHSEDINIIFNNTNSFRAEVGRDNLTLDETLCAAASARATEMAWSGKYSHTRPDGSDCFTVFDDMGITANSKGENIAKGYDSANSVSYGWKGSSGHYLNMTSKKFTKIGIGVATAPDGTQYWCQVFSS